jgi:hypothetical protein
MNIEIHVHVHPESGPGEPVVQRLDRILALLRQSLRGISHMSVELDTLVEKVTAIETVGDSAITLLNDLKIKLDEAIVSDDRDALVALSDRLGLQTQELADAITANTPAA